MTRFLSSYDRDATLLELIAHLEALVKKNKVAAAGAFYVIVETAKEHSDYPKEEIAKNESAPVVAPPIEVEWSAPIPPREPAPIVEAAAVTQTVSDEDIPF